MTNYVVALAGNPNTGKSTVFNALTGLRQHTGNWPGKTVTRAEGGFSLKARRSRSSTCPAPTRSSPASTDEEVARDFILFGEPDVTLVVVDATAARAESQSRAAGARDHRSGGRLPQPDGRGAAAMASRWMRARLERELGVPVVPTVGAPGRRHARAARGDRQGRDGAITRDRAVPDQESAARHRGAVADLVPAIERRSPDCPTSRWVALRLLNADERDRDAPSAAARSASSPASAKSVRWMPARAAEPHARCATP